MDSSLHSSNVLPPTFELEIASLVSPHCLALCSLTILPAEQYKPSVAVAFHCRPLNIFPPNQYRVFCVWLGLFLGVLCLQDHFDKSGTARSRLPPPPQLSSFHSPKYICDFRRDSQFNMGAVQDGKNQVLCAYSENVFKKSFSGHLAKFSGCEFYTFQYLKSQTKHSEL